LKQGGLQAKVRSEWFANCGFRFLAPTIDLIGPKVVVSLSEWAYRAISAVFGLKRIPFRAAVEFRDGFPLSCGARYFPMYHCGSRILNTHRPLARQLLDWSRLRCELSPGGN
jgi:DNA polymerase